MLEGDITSPANKARGSLPDGGNIASLWYHLIYALVDRSHESFPFLFVLLLLHHPPAPTGLIDVRSRVDRSGRCCCYAGSLWYASYSPFHAEFLTSRTAAASGTVNHASMLRFELITHAGWNVHDIAIMLQLLAHCYMLLHPPKKSPYCRSRITVQERNRHYPKAFSWNFAPPRPLLSGKFQLMSTSRRVDVVSAAIRQCFTPPNATICCNCSGRLFVSFLCAFWTAVRKTSPAKSSLVAFAGLPVGRWNVIECLSIRSSMQTDGKSMHHACQRLGEVGGGQRGLQHNSALKAYFIIAVLTGREEGFSPFCTIEDIRSVVNHIAECSIDRWFADSAMSLLVPTPVGFWVFHPFRMHPSAQMTIGRDGIASNKRTIKTEAILWHCLVGCAVIHQGMEFPAWIIIPQI